MCLSACDSGSVAPTAVGQQTIPVAAGAAERYADSGPTFDAQLNEVSLEYPGFKGIVGTGDGTDVTVLVSESEQATAGSARRSAAGDQAGLTRVLVARLGIEPARLTFSEPAAARPADGRDIPAERPDFHVLYDVKTGLRRFMFETDLVTSLDLNEETGRVVVGTENPAQAEQMRASMTPDELANTDFVRAVPDEPFVGEATLANAEGASSMPFRSLRTGRFRPLTAGINTDFRHPSLGGSACTQGPAVQFGTGTYGFLSNAHCTYSRHRIDGVRFSQPSANVAADFVGIEQAEPAYRSGWFITDGFYSDITFVRTNAAVQLRGQVATADGCSRYTADCVENGPASDVIGTVSYLPVNTSVFKTGKETGTTAGRLAETCSDRTQDGDKLLCQNVVRWDAAIGGPQEIAFPGDSGSPVLIRAGTPGTNLAQLVGVLWGGNRNDLSYFNYSPWENIWQQGRAGTAYGLPLQVVTSSRGLVANSAAIPGGGGGTTGGGGGGGGGGSNCPEGLGGEHGYTDQPACPPPSP